MPPVLSYEDKKYLQKKSIYDSVAQAFSDIKNEEYGKHHWNKPVQELKGVTMKLVGEGVLELVYHRFEVCTVEKLARDIDDGKNFIGGVVKELKKKFKNLTGKSLKLKKIKEDRALDKYSNLQSDTSWMLGSNRYGYGARPVGRYLVRDSCVYEFDIDLLQQ